MPTVYEQILLRRGTSLEWAAANPVLGAAEIGAETDTGRFKLGDGVTTWNLLAYKSDRGLPGVAGPAGETGPAGPAGPAGPRGPAGSAAAISIGSVSQGTVPSATITGTSENPILNLVLPKGDTGSAGAATSITIGTVTSGTTPSATFSGTAPNLTLSLVLPKGETGSTGPAGAQGVAGPTGPAGPQGDKGAAAVIKGIITTWPPAASPTLGDLWILGTTIPSGTPSAGATGDGFLYVGGSTTSSVQANGWLDIGQLRGPAGPQGATGATGAQGPTGPAGAQGIQGVAGSQGPAGPTPTMTIGTVTTGAVASASITGTAPNFVLNLVLPSAAAAQQSTVFTIQPLSTTALVGSAVTFTATAQSTETPVVMAWERRDVSNPSSPGSWAAASGTVSNSTGAGTTTSTLTIASVVTGDGNYQYRAKATTATVGTVYSTNATLSVLSQLNGNGDSWYQVYDTGGSRTFSGSDRIFYATLASGAQMFVSGSAWASPSSGNVEVWYPVTGTPQPGPTAYGNGFFLRGGRGVSKAWTSTDGKSWTERTIPNSGYYGANEIAYGSGQFLLAPRGGTAGVASNETLRSTQDGITYSDVTTSNGTIWRNAKVWYLGGKWIAVCSDKYVYYSTNSTAWTKANVGAGTANFNFPLVSALGAEPMPVYCSYGGGKYAMVTPGNVAWSSSDGITWTAVTLPTSADWSGIAYSTTANIFLMVAYNSQTCLTGTASLGSLTVKNTLPASVGWSDVAWGAGVFMTVRETIGGFTGICAMSG